MPARAIHDVEPIQGSLDEDDEDFDGLDDALKDLESDELDSLDKEENKSVHEEEKQDMKLRSADLNN